MYKKQDKEEQLVINSALLSAASQFHGKDAVYSFIEQVLTERERHMIGRRIAIARLILAGATYFEVCEKLKISPNTFRNIRKWISHELPDYKNILNEQNQLSLKKAKKRSTKYRPRIEPFSFADLKSRYPMHFLLFNIADEYFSHKKN